ncbi:hypothetical protein QOZ96_002110 [Brevundimonas nasdae]|uniref:hypothetical protein n=1 Tax=Brevundimonas nasdae TaxID=172043 RepID=UPI0019123A5E|nr:hypothetical protein [Brevundimonas nasdae]MBK6025530.1 hypothetical protein [Brevundimonas nasdae]MDQ0452160.1 hypothetical protein [Brevundimonas nasdae]
MTDTGPTLSFPIIGVGPHYEGQHIWLPQLVVEAARRGEGTIKNKTFVNCFMEGPAVLLPIGGCQFDGCNMGDTMGDARNLLLAPVSPQKVTGSVPFEDCVFINCRFERVGFTGASSFLDELALMLGGATADTLHPKA